MFTVAEIEDEVRVIPGLFGNEEEAVELELSKKYANKVVRGVGLIISVLSIERIESGYVFMGQGASYNKVLCKVIAFMPHVGEIITGTVQQADSTSISVSLDFFDDIRLASTELRDPSVYNPQNQMWYWRYESEGQQHDLYYVTDQPIRVRVKAIEFTKDQTTTDSKYVPPMIVHVTAAEDGLGPPNWW